MEFTKEKLEKLQEQLQQEENKSFQAREKGIVNVSQWRREEFDNLVLDGLQMQPAAAPEGQDDKPAAENETRAMYLARVANIMQADEGFSNLYRLSTYHTANARPAVTNMLYTTELLQEGKHIEDILNPESVNCTQEERRSACIRLKETMRKENGQQCGDLIAAAVRQFNAIDVTEMIANRMNQMLYPAGTAGIEESELVTAADIRELNTKNPELVVRIAQPVMSSLSGMHQELIQLISHSMYGYPVTETKCPTEEQLSLLAEMNREQKGNKKEVFTPDHLEFCKRVVAGIGEAEWDKMQKTQNILKSCRISSLDDRMKEYFYFVNQGMKPDGDLSEMELAAQSANAYQELVSNVIRQNGVLGTTDGEFFSYYTNLLRSPENRKAVADEDRGLMRQQGINAAEKLAEYEKHKPIKNRLNENISRFAEITNQTPIQAEIQEQGITEDETFQNIADVIGVQSNLRRPTAFHSLVNAQLLMEGKPVEEVMNYNSTVVTNKMRLEAIIKVHEAAETPEKFGTFIAEAQKAYANCKIKPVLKNLAGFNPEKPDEEFRNYLEKNPVEAAVNTIPFLQAFGQNVRELRQISSNQLFGSYDHLDLHKPDPEIAEYMCGSHDKPNTLEDKMKADTVRFQASIEAIMQNKNLSDKDRQDKINQENKRYADQLTNTQKHHEDGTALRKAYYTKISDDDYMKFSGACRIYEALGSNRARLGLMELTGETLQLTPQGVDSKENRESGKEAIRSLLDGVAAARGDEIGNFRGHKFEYYTDLSRPEEQRLQMEYDNDQFHMREEMSQRADLLKFAQTEHQKEAEKAAERAASIKGKAPEKISDRTREKTSIDDLEAEDEETAETGRTAFHQREREMRESLVPRTPERKPPENPHIGKQKGR